MPGDAVLGLARIAATTESPSSNIVRTSTPMCGLCATISRVASIPFRSGIWGSMTTTSGWSSAAHATASAPVAAEPATGSPGVVQERAQAVDEDGMVVGD
jgi:hypothetical protein